jgi:hypothetical protein
MRVVIAIFLTATVAMGAGPSLAKTSEAPKAVDEASQPACHAYEQNPDGSWRQLPCQEDGLKPPPASRISTRDAGKATR